MKREIYLDHAATTPMDKRVAAEMAPYFDIEFGNPSALYSIGRRAKGAIDGARLCIAKILQCKADEIIFTGSGTESDNLAILGIARIHAKHGKHLIISAIEHHAVLRAAEALEKEGFEITKIPVGEDGIVRLEEIKKALRPDTILVSIMYANNEIGTIQPIREIGQIIKEARIKKQESRSKNQEAGNSNSFLPYFHTDACQAAGALNLDAHNLGVDLLTFNGSKIYGPKGIGALFVRRGLRLEPLVYGGGQENGMRSGTENTASIVGLARALAIAHENREKKNERLIKLRDYFITEVEKHIPKAILNGHSIKRLPNNINFTFLDVEGEAVLLYLDNEGICVSTGSACTSTTLDPSHVILALGVPYEYAHGSIRFTLGRKTVKKDLDFVLKILPKIIKKLRDISPVSMKVGQKEISHPSAFAGQGAKVKIRGKTYK